MSKPPLKWRIGALYLGGDMPKVLGVVWEFLDGKKVAIGAALQLFADILTLIVAGLPAAAPALGLEAVTVLTITGKAAVVLGLIHKALKWFQAK